MLQKKKKNFLNTISIYYIILLLYIYIECKKVRKIIQFQNDKQRYRRKLVFLITIGFLDLEVGTVCCSVYRRTPLFITLI